MTMWEAFGMTAGETARNGVFCHSEEEVFGYAERFDEESKKIKGKGFFALRLRMTMCEAFGMASGKTARNDNVGSVQNDSKEAARNDNVGNAQNDSKKAARNDNV